MSNTETQEQPTAAQIRANVDAYLQSIGVVYSADFVPQRLSRNSAEKNKSINWRVKFHNSARKSNFETDYMQGIGHIPEVPRCAKGNNYDMVQARAEAAEKGIYYSKKQDHCSWGGKKIPAPSAADVLYSLVLDADATQYDFEEWASNFGYDTDSRKAEQLYNDCRKIASEMRKVFSSVQVAHIAELVREL